jgi:hypothetical protein
VVVVDMVVGMAVVVAVVVVAVVAVVAVVVVATVAVVVVVVEVMTAAGTVSKVVAKNMTLEHPRGVLVSHGHPPGAANLVARKRAVRKHKQMNGRKRKC